MSSIRERFGRRVQQLRAALGESQEAFASRIKMGRSYFGRVERGEVNVSIDNMERIAAGLGVSVQELFNFKRLPKR